MRKLTLTLAAIMALVVSAIATPTYYNGTDKRGPEVLGEGGFSVLMVDALLGPGDTVYSRPYDIINVPIAYRDTGTGDGALVPDLGMGNGILSCYDASDSAAVTDSTDITGQLYVSQYAADNNNPLIAGESAGKNDAWATLGSAYSIDAASASSAINEANAAITMGSQLDRFVRIRLINNNATIKDRSRCRFYWVKKKKLR